VAGACFNFYFLPPIGTFAIADTKNWIALFAFLGTSIIASQLSNRIKTEARQATARQREVEILFHLSRELLRTENVAELLNAIPTCVKATTGVGAVGLYLEQKEELLFSPGNSSGVREGIDLRTAAQLPQITTDGEWKIVPVRVGVRPRGALLLKGCAISEGTLEALGGLVSIAIDRAEALEHAARSEAAKENERLRTALLDSITHELRTPLTAIKASATALLSTAGMDAPTRTEMLAVIDEESDRLNHLIAQAVQMVQLDSQEIHMDVSPQSVAELIDNARQTSASVLAGHRVELLLTNNLPAVQADPIWLESVLCNLLENAAKYSSPGQPITITAEERDGSMAIGVTDHGSGIEPAEQDLIFEKFYRGQEQKSHVSGTGMGLAICRAIMEAHHGSISVTSRPGEGSTFTCVLPIVQALLP
jgi:two-component system sensor histidine kinase KdpD